MSDNLQIIGALLEQAGFLAAHALWCVSDGGPLVPFVGMEFQGGKRTLDRYVDEEHLERAVERASSPLKKCEFVTRRQSVHSASRNAPVDAPDS
ncbi:MAG: hypothetical protein IT459_16385 [Planctomycetes bacterium]|nr:hypothetical protein [Planctomycetota bacterium]